jgi:hypothetical protein
MNDSIIHNKPEILPEIQAKSKEIGFSMPSDHYVGSLLKTLVHWNHPYDEKNLIMQEWALRT